LNRAAKVGYIPPRQEALLQQEISEHQVEHRQRTRDRIIREAEQRELTGLSRTTRWRLSRNGEYPKQVKLTGHARGVRESELEAWLKALPSTDGSA
jgi:prophage regulatory protein